MSNNVRLGAFIVGALAILAVGIFLIGDEKFMFSSTYQLNSSFDSVIGLKEGAAVRVGGVHKGTVTHIQLPANPGGKVTVLMDLENSTRDVIKQDSESSIETEGLLGDKYIAVSFGSAQAPDVQDGDSIGSRPPVDFAALVKKADTILDSTEATVRNANQITENFREVGEKINRGKGTVGALINDRRMYEEATTAARNAQQGVKAFEENMEALKHNWFLRGFFKERGYTDTKELTKNAIANLPQAPPLEEFGFGGKDIFDKPDTAKLEGKQALDKVGKFLEANSFGLAVVVASTGIEGDKNENLILSQARAMVVREYLVDHFRVDDARLKTIGAGESSRPQPDSFGEVSIVVYPVGVEAPVAKTSANKIGP
ncbi:MAG: MCE family protein [Acidobacteria bacterium]|nr:MCE family protein [Acidobacteriota bacterium]